ncbi:hypothetical protein F3Y22_tig00002058pilonHSYRG00011 [Hibiscus syriacus]|uniref:Uncharacterized protein n=1 Tax=Hibiscus syriacus TaxID=106335 RepID=A0A6A3CYK2_HIBSY|nr:hypothetical protein F3Y22_tig00002058pilonHSYRG00011 [Hibiscus syriacus]
MNRNDIAVGVGGEGGIVEDGTILPNVGGYLPIIEQSMATAGYCRYRQAIPAGYGGRLDIDTNFGLRKACLPLGSRKYSPLQQPAAQQVMIETISAGLKIRAVAVPEMLARLASQTLVVILVLHSGIPITIVPLDATITIPITEEFFKAFEASQGTYEAEYCFQSLKTKIALDSADEFDSITSAKEFTA